MDLKYQMRTLDFINKIINRRADELSFVGSPMYKDAYFQTAQETDAGSPQSVNPRQSGRIGSAQNEQTGHSKADAAADRPSQSYVRLKRSTPEEQGVESGRLASFLRSLAASEEINLHTAMVIRNGFVISEASCYPYKADLWHVTHSLSKSVTGLAVGLAVEEGLLTIDDKLVDLFKKRISPLTVLRKKNLTIKHLLTMSSGISFNEAGAVTENDWVRGYLDSSLLFEPGSEFYYNSMNSYMLSAAIREVTGMGLMEYLTPRLFEPMGIRKVCWQKCPKGIETGGWGLYLCPEDMAKLGVLMLNKGNWEGRQLIPAKWIEESSVKRMETPDELGEYGYGYQVWMCGRPGSFQFNGMLGQNVIIYPDINMVIVTTAGSEELFQVSGINVVVEKYFSPDYKPETAALPADPIALLDLRETEQRLRCLTERREEIRMRGGWKKGPVGIVRKKQELSLRSRKTESVRTDVLKRLDGLSYEMARPAGSLLPLFLQCFHNNFTKGVEGISFEYRQNTFLLSVREGGAEHKVPVGFDRAERADLNLNGENYLTACTGSLREDEDGRKILLVRIYFLEEANVRTIKIRFGEERILVKLTEQPGRKMILDGVGSVFNSAKGIVGTVTNVLDAEYIEYKLRNAIDIEIAGMRKNKE